MNTVPDIALQTEAAPKNKRVLIIGDRKGPASLILEMASMAGLLAPVAERAVLTDAQEDSIISRAKAKRERKRNRNFKVKANGGFGE